jgi:hypothetical protein
LELATPLSTDYNIDDRRKHFGRIIFHTVDVDKLYSYLKNNQDLSNAILLKMSLEMLHGVKDIFIYLTQTDISYHLQVIKETENKS